MKEPQPGPDVLRGGFLKKRGAENAAVAKTTLWDAFFFNL